MKGVALSRIALGALLVARPDVAPRITRTPPTRGTVVLSRVLGVRYVGQGALALAVPHDRRIDAGVELLHAASMLPVAYAERRHARLALLSAAAAFALAVADLSAGSGGDPSDR